MATKKPSTMVVKLLARGNPDLRQAEALPGVYLERPACKSLEEASQLCRVYIERHQLGAGNWVGGQVSLAGKELARVSYNGRVWGLDGKEITF